MKRFYAIVTTSAEWDDRKQTTFGGSVELYDQNAQQIATCDDNMESIAVTLETYTGTPSCSVTYIDSLEEIAKIDG